MSSNLFDDLPTNLPEELVEVLAEGTHVRVQRIISTGQHSPRGNWYDQSEHEWVVVLSGEARLLFQDDGTTVHLRRGDHITIPARRKHRVEWTARDQPTLWLAVFYK